MKRLTFLLIALIGIIMMSGCTSEVRGLVIIDGEAVLESVAIDDAPVSFEKTEEGYYFYGNKSSHRYIVMFTLSDRRAVYMLVYPNLKNNYRFYIGEVNNSLFKYSILSIEAL